MFDGEPDALKGARPVREGWFDFRESGIGSLRS